jgi:hypothetical protein
VGCTTMPCCSVVAEAVWWGGMAALLPLGRQSNGGKRQCAVQGRRDEGKTKDACDFDLRSYLAFGRGGFGHREVTDGWIGLVIKYKLGF